MYIPTPYPSPIFQTVFLHPPPTQETLHLLLAMPLDHHLPGQRINLNILILLIQPHPQLIPQLRQVARDLAHHGQVQIAAPLVVGIDGEVAVLGARDDVFGRWEVD